MISNCDRGQMIIWPKSYLVPALQLGVVEIEFQGFQRRLCGRRAAATTHIKGL